MCERHIAQLGEEGLMHALQSIGWEKPAAGNGPAGARACGGAFACADVLVHALEVGALASRLLATMQGRR